MLLQRMQSAIVHAKDKGCTFHFQKLVFDHFYISQLKCQRNVTSLDSFINPRGILYCEIKLQ